jgi:hypothetical protein
MKLLARVVPLADVTAAQRDAMFALMDRHYVNVRRDVFEADLNEKQWVIQVSHPETGALCGFSTQRLLRLEFDSRPITALFSGDTIIDREHWGDQALTRAWGRFALTLMDQADTELWWFLISQGYKTYRFLPVFFREFYPRHDVVTPGWASALIDLLGQARYPDDYDPAAGIIRATSRQYRLREGLAEITPERACDPHVRFFQARNPGHARGDELCCLAPLTRANFTRAAWWAIGPQPAAVEA